MWPNLSEIANLITYTEEILKGKLHFLCSASWMWKLNLINHCAVPVKVFRTQRRIQNPVKHLRWSFFVKIVNDWKPLTIFPKSSIVDGWLGSEYTSGTVVLMVFFIYAHGCFYRKYFLHMHVDVFLYTMFCAIWYHLYCLKNVKNTHGGVLLLVKLQAFIQQRY